MAYGLDGLILLNQVTMRVTDMSFTNIYDSNWRSSHPITLLDVQYNGLIDISFPQA